MNELLAWWVHQKPETQEAADPSPRRRPLRFLARLLRRRWRAPEPEKTHGLPND
jgi:hypothetical protein